jgi:hypothetical protein
MKKGAVAVRRSSTNRTSGIGASNKACLILNL